MKTSCRRILWIASIIALLITTITIQASGTFSDANWISTGGILGSNGTVNAAVVDGSGNLYVGGWFRTERGSVADNVAKWNGTNWSAFGSGMNWVVWSVAVSGSNLYVGGQFTTVDGIEANRIAKWNGSSWSALGSGIGGSDVVNLNVTALAVSGTNLYAGGQFSTAGGIAVNRIAKWNGSSWSALGLGIGANDGFAYVAKLAVSGTNLYAGGYFTTAGSVFANCIAKWNGSSWSALGSGMNGSVGALEVSGSDLYAGGTFTMATNSGGATVTVNRIAKWNGSSWSALGSGVGGADGTVPSVQALAVSGTDVYAGGFFSTAGGSAADYIAKWNGSSWSTLGSGMNSHVFALAVSGSDLYAAGYFTTAGGKTSPNLARAYLERPLLSVVRSGGNLTLFWPAFYDTFVLQQNPDAANPNTWSSAVYPLTTNGNIKSATAPLTPTNQFFRLKSN